MFARRRPSTTSGGARRGLGRGPCAHALGSSALAGSAAGSSAGFAGSLGASTASLTGSSLAGSAAGSAALGSSAGLVSAGLAGSAAACACEPVDRWASAKLDGVEQTLTTRDRDLLGGLGRGLGRLLGDGALARLLALGLLGGRLDDLRRRGLALDGGLGLLGGDDGLGGGRRGVGVLGEGGGRHGCLRVVGGVVERRWRCDIDFAHGRSTACGGGKKICYLRGKRGQKAAQRSAAAAAARVCGARAAAWWRTASSSNSRSGRFGAIHSAAGLLARKKARNRVALYLKGARDGR